MGSKSTVIQFCNNSAVINRILSGCDDRIFDHINRAVIRDVIAVSSCIGATHVTIEYAIGTVDRAGIDRADAAAIVENRITARRQDGHSSHACDRRPVVEDYRNISIHILDVL